MIWANIALVIVTFLLVAVTYSYVRLTRKLVQSQTDPCVTAYLQKNRECEDVIDIAVENIGNGIARDVHLGPSNNSKDADKWEKLLNGTNCTSGFSDIIKRGIPTLRPGEKRIVRWCRSDQMEFDSSFSVICRFKRFDQGRESEVDPIECIFDVTFDSDWKPE